MFSVQKLDLLISFYICCIVLSELMGAKTFPLATIGGYQLNASVAIFILPLIYSINDVIVEVYGKERAKSIVRSGLMIVGFIFTFSLLATYLPPSARFTASESAYDMVFGMSARLSAASLIAFTFAEFLDVYVYATLRETLGKKKLWLRNNVSNFVSQFIDTVVFMTLAFWSFDKPFAINTLFLWSLILPYWIVKCCMSIIETPLVYLGVYWLQSEPKK